MNTGDEEADHRRWVEELTARENVQIWAVLGFGVAGAGLGGWGWRSPRERRFHITYLSGLGVMVLDYIHVRLIQGHVAVLEYLSEEEDRSFFFNDVMFPVSIAVMALVVGVVLFLVALLLDRPR